MDEIGRAAQTLVDHNRSALDSDDDVGLSLFVTPGPYSTYAALDSGPLAVMHTIPLPFEQWERKYREGQSLVVTSIRQVPTACWPAELKCRSRMHYYLADREAARIQPGARALMLDLDGAPVEASTANLVIYRRNEGFISPPREVILPGVSVAFLEHLCAESGTPFLYRTLTMDDVLTADEALLCSTSPCLLPVVEVDGVSLSGGSPGPVFDKFLTLWGEKVQVDLRGQAARFAGRTAA